MTTTEMRELDAWINNNIPHGESQSNFFPTIRAEDAMLGLKKCAEKIAPSDVEIRIPDAGNYMIRCAEIEAFGKTLELAICLFARQVWEGKV